MVVYFLAKQFSAKKSIVQVPLPVRKKEFLNQRRRTLHITGYQASMKITTVLGITNLNTISFSS